MTRQDGIKRLGWTKVVWVIAVSTVLCMPVYAAAPTRSEVAKELSDAFSAAAKSAMPAVVSIKVEKVIQAAPGQGMFGFNNPYGQFNDEFLRRFFGDQFPQAQSPRKYVQQGQGSGFIISKDGYILTNNHVVGDVDKIKVVLQDGRTFDDAKVIGTDPDSEVALIKIEGDDFPVLEMGDSSKIQIGDWVIAIGNPFGLSETVTVGVISAVGRSNMHIAAYEDFIQTDAAINPGNSGGPLINLDGKVIGINTAIVSESGGYMGIGFAIPINMARTIEEQLKAQGKVTRGYLGLYGQDVTQDIAELRGLKEAAGVQVNQVEPGSPAAEGGLQSLDVILEMDGKKVTTYDQFRNDIALLKPGTEVHFVVWRDGHTVDLTVALGERPSTAAKGQPSTEEPQQSLGLEVQALTRSLANQFGYSLGEGVLVSAVMPGSPAADAGIQPGDLITVVNNEKVTSVGDFTAAVRASRKTGKVGLMVKRGEVSQYLVIQFE
jgi:serine protease Do